MEAVADLFSDPHAGLQASKGDAVLRHTTKLSKYRILFRLNNHNANYNHSVYASWRISSDRVLLLGRTRRRKVCGTRRERRFAPDRCKYKLPPQIGRASCRERV